MQSALIAYIEGGVGEPIQVNAVAQDPVMLPSVDAELEEQELLVPSSDELAISEANGKQLVAKDKEKSQSAIVSGKRAKAPDAYRNADQATEVVASKRRGRGRSAS